MTSINIEERLSTEIEPIWIFDGQYRYRSKQFRPDRIGPIDLKFVLLPALSLDSDNSCNQLPPKVPYVFSPRSY